MASWLKPTPLSLPSDQMMLLDGFYPLAHAWASRQKGI